MRKRSLFLCTSAVIFLLSCKSTSPGANRGDAEAARLESTASKDELPIRLTKDNEQRLKDAEKLLHRKLSLKEKAAILTAHAVGMGEKGKNGENAGLNNFTPKQIARKTRILSEAGINQDERRALMENRIVGFFSDMLCEPGEVLSDTITTICNSARDRDCMPYSNGGIRRCLCTATCLPPEESDDRYGGFTP